MAQASPPSDDSNSAAFGDAPHLHRKLGELIAATQSVVAELDTLNQLCTQLRGLGATWVHSTVVRALAELLGPLFGLRSPLPVPAQEHPRAPLALPERELSALNLAALGLSNTEIGERLGMSTSSAKKILHLAFTRLGGRSRTHAVALAAQQGLLHLGPARVYLPGEKPPPHARIALLDERGRLWLRAEGLNQWAHPSTGPLAFTALPTPLVAVPLPVFEAEVAYAEWVRTPPRQS